MSLQYKNRELYLEDVACSALADEFGTPLFAYSQQIIDENVAAFFQAIYPWNGKVFYAVKANSNLAILQHLHTLGCGFDLVSAGEMQRCLRIGVPPESMILSGVGKNKEELVAALRVGIGCFNIESIGEIHRLAELAAACNTTARVSVRVNPNVDAKTHPYISTGLAVNKFGIGIEDVVAAYTIISQCRSLQAVGIDFHIGSQILTAAPYQQAVASISNIICQLNRIGIALQHIDIGGGFGIRYNDEVALQPQQIFAALREQFDALNLPLWVEPGRSIIGAAGILLTAVELKKTNKNKNFVIVDSGMHHLIRPSLYNAYHHIQEVKQPQQPSQQYDVVGPICESTDFLGKDRLLDVAVGDLLAVRDVGAYASVMASNYNTRARPAEVLVSGSSVRCIRQRDTLDEMLKNEVCGIL